MININNHLKNNYHILINIILIFSIYLGFFFDENITQGPKLDFNHALKQVSAFKEDFYFTFFNYDKIENSTRISPIFTSLLYLIIEITGNTYSARFIILNFLVLNQFFFYKCLKISLKKFNFDNKYLLLLSATIYLSPSFRANIIWPESAMFGLLFFLISLYFFLKFKVNQRFNYVLLNIFFLAVASYLRPSYSLFSIYFFYKFFEYFFKNRLFQDIFIIIGFNFLLSFPAFYYIFILDIFFIDTGGLSSNYVNKFFIISTIILFHLIPIIFFFKKQIFDEIKSEIKIISLIIITFAIVVNKFDYDLSFAGGGIILHLSDFLFGNNYFFYFFYLISVYILLKLILIDKVNNFLITLTLLLITPQYHIFHKYYDPLVIILALTILNFDKIYYLLNRKHFILAIYGFYISLNIMHIINIYIN